MNKKNILICLFICLFLFVSNFTFSQTENRENQKTVKVVLDIPPIGISILNGLIPFFGLWSYFQGDMKAGIAQSVLTGIGVALMVAGPFAGVASATGGNPGSAIGGGITALVLYGLGGVLVGISWLIGVIRPYVFAKQQNRIGSNNLLERQIVKNLQNYANITNTNKIVDVSKNITNNNINRQLVTSFPIYNIQF